MEYWSVVKYALRHHCIPKPITPLLQHSSLPFLIEIPVGLD